MRMAEPWETLYTEWHRYPRSRRTGGKGKTNLGKRVKELEKTVRKLNEFKEKREESMFYFKAQMERAKPKTASEAEDLQRAKEIFEKLYREELDYLEEENKRLKEENKELREYKARSDFYIYSFI